MTIKTLQKHIATTRLKLDALRKERNVLIRNRYKELYNIETWHKVRAEYVYSTIAKESGLSISLVKKIIHPKK